MEVLLCRYSAGVSLLHAEFVADRENVSPLGQVSELGGVQQKSLAVAFILTKLLHCAERG